MPTVPLPAFVAAIESSPLAPWLGLEPWEITGRSEAIVRRLIEDLSRDEFVLADGIAIHRTAIVEPGAVLKGPLLVGAGCFIAAGAYLRGGNWLAERCTLGPGTELKSSFVLAGTALAHFNFVGDSIVGSGVNFEAGSVVCNHRNERTDAEVRVRRAGALQRTGCRKFGAVVGDGSRIGANAVLAPGALLLPGTVVARGSVRDDELAP